MNKNPISCAIKNTALYIVLVGLFLIALGVAIVFMPEIITYLVVAFFVLTGLLSLIFGIKIFGLYKKAQELLKKFKIE